MAQSRPERLGAAPASVSTSAEVEAQAGVEEAETGADTDAEALLISKLVSN